MRPALGALGTSEGFGAGAGATDVSGSGEASCGPCMARARRGRLSALSVSLCESVFYGAFVWARGALNSPKRRFPARAGAQDRHHHQG
jgi:hypothetical protein